MQVSVEDVSPVKKILHIEVPQEQVAREIDSAYRQLSKTAKIKGFRPGKAPRSVLERMFRKDVHSDVTSRLIQESFIDAIKETDLKIIGSPQVDPPEISAGEPYRFDAAVEVRPEIADIEFKGLKLKKSVYEISEEEIEAQLKALQKNLARSKPLEENRPAEKGDLVALDYEGLKDGRPHPETKRTENYTTKIGAGKVLPEFDEGLVGMEVGQTKEIKVQFPEDYFNKTLAGVPIDFQVTLNEIREEVLPEIDDAMARQAGNYQNLDELRAQIRTNLEEGYAKRVEQELNEQIFKELIRQHDFEVPPTMVQYELDGIVEEAERSFAYRNVSLEEIGLSRESIAEKYRDTAVRQVKRHLILDKIIDQEGLELEDGELDKGLAEMAESFGQPVENIKRYYSQSPEKLDYFKHSLLEKKAIKLIIDSSEIEEVEGSASETGDTEATTDGDAS